MLGLLGLGLLLTGFPTCQAVKLIDKEQIIIKELVEITEKREWREWGSSVETAPAETGLGRHANSFLTPTYGVRGAASPPNVKKERQEKIRQDRSD